MTVRRRLITVTLGGVAAMMVTLAAWSGDGYVLGTTYAARQANHCADKGEAMQILQVFRTRGARPGYDALEAAASCRRRVTAFTPDAIVDRVVIEPGKENEYTVSLVEVVTDGGETLYLVTTRPVTGE